MRLTVSRETPECRAISRYFTPSTTKTVLCFSSTISSVAQSRKSTIDSHFQSHFSRRSTWRNSAWRSPSDPLGIPASSQIDSQIKEHPQTFCLISVSIDTTPPCTDSSKKLLTLLFPSLYCYHKTRIYKSHCILKLSFLSVVIFNFKIPIPLFAFAARTLANKRSSCL